MADATFWVGQTNDIPIINADGNIFEETQVATAAQTVFTLLTFTYEPNTTSIFVHQNGILLRRGVDYTETASNTITLATGATAGDRLTFNAYALQQLIPPVVFNGLPAGGSTNQVLVKASGSDYDAEWENADAQTTLLDAARVNVASASTINLVAIEDTTRNIQITGSVQIDGFQITNGQVWVARFSGSLVLKNNANTVTQSSGDIRVSSGDTCLIRATADNVVEIIAFSRASTGMAKVKQDFRLTLTTGVPVTSTDVLAASTIYLTPYVGNEISLYDGTSWVTRTSAEISIALSGLTASRPYDIFCYDNAGVPTLELLSWTSAAVRATALVRQDGFLVKSGDTTRRYLGSAYILTATTTEDSARRRLLFNYYNRARKLLARVETVGSWNYTVTTVRQANGNVLNQVEFMLGVAEEIPEVLLIASINNTGPSTVALSLGLDSTTTSNGCTCGYAGISGASAVVTLTSKLTQMPAEGYHFVSWNEVSQNVGTTTWNGSSSILTLNITSGISGAINT